MIHVDKYLSLDINGKTILNIKLLLLFLLLSLFLLLLLIVIFVFVCRPIIRWTA